MHTWWDKANLTHRGRVKSGRQEGTSRRWELRGLMIMPGTRKNLSKIGYFPRPLSSLHFHPYLWTSGHSNSEMDGQSVQTWVNVFDYCCSSPGPCTPLVLEPFSGVVACSGGWDDRPRMWNLFPMLNFFPLCLTISEVLFLVKGTISTWVNPGHLKKMEVSGMDTSYPPGGVCLPYFLPLPFSNLFPVTFVILFSSF